MRDAQFIINGQPVSGKELDFEPLQERWNEYRCEDGSLVKIRCIVGKIIRLEARDEMGQARYQIVSTNVLISSEPQALGDPI